jgi:hypothetical protein
MHGDGRIEPGGPIERFDPALGKRPYVVYLSNVLPMQLDRFIQPRHAMAPWKEILQGLLQIVPEERMTSDDIWLHLSQHPDAAGVCDPTTKARLARRSGAGIPSPACRAHPILAALEPNAWSLGRRPSCYGCPTSSCRRTSDIRGVGDPTRTNGWGLRGNVTCICIYRYHSVGVRISKAPKCASNISWTSWAVEQPSGNIPKSCCIAISLTLQ